MMVFYRLSERVWTLKNVGEGTAVKVIIRNYISESQVRDEVTLYPVATSEEIRLDYVKGPAVKLVARYVNIFGQDPHYTVCSADINETKPGEFKDNVTLSFGQGCESQVQQWPFTRLSKR